MRYKRSSARRFGLLATRSTGARRGPLTEALEGRVLFDVTDLGVPIQSFVAHPGSPATDTLDLTTKFTNPATPGTVVELRTSGGVIDLALTDAATPNTVKNFLSYVNSGEFNNTLFSRSVPGFVEQLGGYSLNDLRGHIPTGPAIGNEFATAVGDSSNTRQVLALLSLDSTLGGTYVLSYDGRSTPALAFDTSAADLQTAINNLFTSLDNGFTASVTGGTPTTSGGGLEITLSDPSGNNAAFDPFTLDTSGLTGTVSAAHLAPAKNLTGTIAMALSGNTNDTATSEWFFNLADNSANLDAQNGGFTVFGNVISGFDTVIAPLENLPVEDLSTLVGNGALTQVPLQNFDPSKDKLNNITFSNLVTLRQATVVPAITYTVTSTNTDLIRPSVDGSTLSFKYAAGRSGSALIALTATGVDGSTHSRSFVVTVPDASAGNTAGPVAVDDTPAPAVTGQPLLIRLVNNDTDAVSPLAFGQIQVTTQPQHGSVSIDTNAGFATYISDAAYTGPDSFQYTIADVAGTVSAPGTVTLKVSGAAAAVTIGTAVRHALSYTEPDGTKSVVSVGGGTAVITFAGSDVVVDTVRGVAVVSGADATITDITVTSPTGRSASLVVTGRGGTDNGVVTLGTINGHNFTSIIAPTADVTGDMKVVSVGRLVLGSTHNCQLNFGGSVGLFVLNNAVDTNILALGSLGIVRSQQWVSSTGFDYTITAADATALVTTGDFADSLKLTGNGGLRIGRIGGRISQGTWSVTGVIGALTLLHSPDPSWSLTTQNLIGTMAVVGDLANDVSCGAIGTLLVTGNLTGASVFTGASLQKGFIQLRALVVRGNITNSTIRGNGNLGLIAATGIDGSGIFAGMNDTLDPATLPTITDFSQFATASSISAVRVGHFSDTRIAGWVVGSLSLGTITTANGGKPDGVAGITFGVIVGKLDDGTRLVLGRAQLKTNTTFTDYVAAKALPLQDFTVSVVPQK